jgi:hypothetical protein
VNVKFRFDKDVLGLLEGAIDIHIHSAPDVYPRLLNDVELAPVPFHEPGPKPRPRRKTFAFIPDLFLSRM